LTHRPQASEQTHVVDNTTIN